MSVTLYGPKGYFNTYATLDTGSTYSPLATDVAKNLGLDGPMESVLLNGIQKSSELLTKRVDVQVSQLNDFGTRFDVHRVLVVDGIMRFRCFGRIKTTNFLTIVLWLFIDLVF